MSYQVLARKWRPRTFRQMVGQEHVLKALINALDRNRLHHAYLFTGTRGVGKTTIARILAKCLNCEKGVGSEPCGHCTACVEISEGRFVDLIEVDAASRTRVEDTRELLDNVQYAPSRGRYKIYLIDEVHMLSNHSFNALLKTLEEPPEHVKFLLATTDPQKLPVTILSRCLQFNLKNMSPERIVAHLRVVLGEEKVPFEESALWLLARAADGSMRDALSLTDQAIGFGNGKIADNDVSAMLGTIDHRLIERLISALIGSKGRDVLQAVAEFAEQAPDYVSALEDLATLLHRIAIAQAVPEALDNSYGDRDKILDFASRLTAEDVQLYYQIALLGRRDLALAPDPRVGFEMVLLRMLAFRPQGVVDVPTRPLASSTESSSTPPVGSGAQPLASQLNAAMPNAVTPSSATPSLGSFGALAPASPPLQTPPPEAPKPTAQEAAPAEKKPIAEAGARRPLLAELESSGRVKPVSAPTPEPPPPPAPAAKPEPPTELALASLTPVHWLSLYEQLSVRGVLQSTLMNSVLVKCEGHQLNFKLDPGKGSLYDDSHNQRLADLLSDFFGEPVKVRIEPGELPPGAMTPAMAHEQLRRELKQNALDRLRADPVVLSLEKEFGAKLDPERVQVSVSVKG